MDEAKHSPTLSAQSMRVLQLFQKENSVAQESTSSCDTTAQSSDTSDGRHTGQSAEDVTRTLERSEQRAKRLGREVAQLKQRLQDGAKELARLQAANLAERAHYKADMQRLEEEKEELERRQQSIADMKKQLHAQGQVSNEALASAQGPEPGA